MQTGCVLIGLLMLVVLTSQQDGRQWWKEVLAEHNRYRSMARNGKIPGQPAASRMPMLTWDRRLADDAERWSYYCQLEHDHSTRDGENLAFDTNKQNSAVKAWFMEYKDFSFGPIPNYSYRVILHYTQIVWANTTRLGCFKRFCPYFYAWGRVINNAYFTVCRYSPKGNWIGELPYTPR
ncbi:cysteine-rich secretory protein [Paragonimus westermani]|uniref:Cysteine-rich secretory protein n=1 Tax=Paragonimus westermani TaxID=34504 RepID=A0A5J4NDE3_9TREM|nr:cysteine-rich secretory protein [Paragonimus westermani]